MGARFQYWLVIPIMAGLTGWMIGLLFLPVGAAPAETPVFKQVSEAQWTRMLPELGEASPEMTILHEDTKTHATQLLIRAPKALHVRKH